MNSSTATHYSYLSSDNSDFRFYWFIASSLLFHLVLFAIMLIAHELNPPAPLPQTEITWVNLGSPLNLDTTKSGIAGSGNIKEVQPPKEVAPPKEATAPKQEIKKEAVVKETPKTKTTTPPKEAVVLNPKKTKEVTKTENKTTKEITKTSATNTEKPKPKTSAQDNQINNALAKITGDLASEQKAQAGSGNATGAGSAAGAVGGSGSNSECGSYSNAIKQRILNNWRGMRGENKPLRPPVANIKISASGGVASVSWRQKSGDLAWDNAAQKAIQSTSFPALPQNCAVALSGGITVQFGR